MNDEELVAGLQKGDREAQITLLDRYQEKLVEYLQNHFSTLDSGDIEEIVADSIYRVIIEPSIIDLSKGKIGSFLLTVARRKAVDLFRNKQTTLKEIKVFSLDDELTVDEVSSKHWQDDRFHHEETQKSPNIYPPEVIFAIQQVIEALRLTEAELDHIRLRLVEKLQPKEIAEFNGISANYEGVRWHRLMKKIENEWIKQPVLVKYATQQGIEVPQV